MDIRFLPEASLCLPAIMSLRQIGKRILVDLTAGAFDAPESSSCTHSCSTCPNAGSCGSTTYSAFRSQGGFEFERSGHKVEVDPAASLPGNQGVQLDVTNGPTGGASAGEFAALGPRAVGPSQRGAPHTSGLVMTRQAVSGLPGDAAQFPHASTAGRSAAHASVGDGYESGVKHDTLASSYQNPNVQSRIPGDLSLGHNTQADALSKTQIVNDVLRQLGIA